ncbi:MAG TPA: hypothetical protein VHC69_23750 [Polyangiaceae bacterium]|nr:hypothetical protein [Polyangiaceae bacterium]
MVENSPPAPGVRRRSLHEWLPNAAYACLAGALVLLAARLFYSSLKLQLFYSSVRGDPLLLPAEWSAPLDDVFIHFDFARSAARGHPFEWSAGNGYSSGGTSLLYPLILSPGFWLGFSGPGLMHFAALVACTSVFATLLVAKRLFRSLPGWTAFIAPPFFLGVGALDWSLFSGMEVAFFLGIWALCFAFWDDLVSSSVSEFVAVRRGVVALGVANALLVATRPEAIVVAFVFAASVGLAVARRRDFRSGRDVFFLAMSFACAVLVVQAVANRLLTGDWSAAGAVVKLEMNDPRLSFREVVEAWLFHVRYQVGRVTGYHLADGLAWGSPFWILPALPLFFEKTRSRAVLLWAQAVLWVSIVAFNGQVRWQNERYTMPAVAWMLLCAALGVGAVLSHGFERARRPWIARALASTAVVALVAVLGVHQIPKMRDQIWFFGRASRNIEEQHIKVGRKIRREMEPVRRVLVGDAGAIPYASDLPALDIIGLGGYPKLPFARASRWGIAAALELIQHIPDDERPDIMAIYPSWWGDMPAWFGTPVDGVSVRGNVICGGLTKMIYRAHWEALDAGNVPSSLSPDHERVVDEADLGDLLSEAAHGYRISGAPGFVAMKLLSAPAGGKSAELDDVDADDDALRRRSAVPGAKDGSGAVAIWDAGRVVPPGASITVTLRGFSPEHSVRLVARTAPSQSGALAIRVEGTSLPDVPLKSGDSWYEADIDVPPGLVQGRMTITITVLENEMVLYHLWGLEAQ